MLAMPKGSTNMQPDRLAAAMEGRVWQGEGAVGQAAGNKLSQSDAY